MPSMRAGVVLSAIALLLVLPNPASSCSLVHVRQGLPEPEPPRIVGRVTGYGDESRPVPGVARAVSLRIDIESVISGDVERGEHSVVLLFYGASCGSVSMRYDDVVKMYPVGIRVAASSTGRLPARPDGPIVVEQNRGGLRRCPARGDPAYRRWRSGFRSIRPLSGSGCLASSSSTGRCWQFGPPIVPSDSGGC